ncbi:MULTISPECIES: AbrB family transcriptional regulator [Bacillaceae]|jgi:antitoxin MazE|uniref:AbrB/MazE/SpoVT family DNA-binding domain-containing protein n=1 Tax=Bacillales TaxID=1385 RepID=UPI00351CA487
MGMVKEMEMERKVTKVGNSLGINMTEALRKIGAIQGDLLAVEVDGDVIKITKRQQKVSLPEGLSPDFFDVLNSTLNEYDETIKGLKDR